MWNKETVWNRYKTRVIGFYKEYKMRKRGMLEILKQRAVPEAE